MLSCNDLMICQSISIAPTMMMMMMITVTTTMRQDHVVLTVSQITNALMLSVLLQSPGRAGVLAVFRVAIEDVLIQWTGRFASARRGRGDRSWVVRYQAILLGRALVARLWMVEIVGRFGHGFSVNIYSVNATIIIKIEENKVISFEELIFKKYYLPCPIKLPLI